MPRFLRPRLAALSLLGGLAAAAAAAALTACPGTTTPAGFVPIEGVTLNLGDVLGSLRCGTGPGQVYKYTVVVWDAAADGGPLGPPRYSNVWDCFSQAVFDNLPSSEAGSSTFFLRIYAYSYEGSLALQASTGAGVGGADGSIDSAFWCQGGVGAGGAPCPFQTAAMAATFGGQAQWTASCTATEPYMAPITALCGPLEALGGSSSDAAAEASSDATAGAADAADASADSGEAGEAGAPDSSADTSTTDSSAPEAASSDAGAADSSNSESGAPDSSTEAGD